MRYVQRGNLVVDRTILHNPRYPSKIYGYYVGMAIVVCLTSLLTALANARCLSAVYLEARATTSASIIAKCYLTH